jgi:ADP-ribosylglycohydrolase
VSPACYIDDAFPASLYLAWRYAGDFEAGVVANTNVGGENCHRGAVVGALLGAASGMAALPAKFVNHIHGSVRLRGQIEQVVDLQSVPAYRG